MKVIVKGIVFLLAVLVSTATIGWGQAVSTARITGVVTDSAGAAIPGAAVQVTQGGTGAVRSTTSAGDGAFSIPDLPIDTYTIRVQKEGFSTFEQKGITLVVGSTATVNAALAVGAVTQTVEVTAYSDLIETHSSSLGQLISNEQILDIPLNARDPMQLLTLTPAAIQTTAGGFNGSFEFPNPFTVAFAGTSPGSGTYILDGGNDNNGHNNGSFPLPFPDALQEFKAETSAVPAALGMHSAATINAVTKSGTNELHGTLFEFVRNYIFNARNYFSPVLTCQYCHGGREPLKRNQFGGTVGGPIMRSKKLYFFGALQDTIVRSQTPTNTASLPTTAELNGDFTAATSAGCNGGTPIVLKNLGPGSTATTTPTSNFSAPSVALAKLLPTPTDQQCGSYTYKIKVATTQYNIVGKVDYTINDKQSVFFRYYYDSYFLPPDTTTFLTLNQSSQTDRYNTATAGYTYLITPKLVNVLHGNLNREYAFKANPPDVVTAATLGSQGFYAPLPNYINLTVNGFWNVKGGTGVTPVYFNATDMQATDDIQWSKGSHNFAAGFNWVQFQDNSLSPIYIDGSFIFTNGLTNYAMADYFLGNINTFEQSNYVKGYNRRNFTGYYAQDSWSATRKLTVNYGIRYEPLHPNWSKPDEGYHFDQTSFMNGVHSKVFTNAPAGLQYPGDYPGYGNIYLAQSNHIEPRVGISFDPGGQGKEVIRASYGYFFDFEGLQYDQQVPQSAPWGDAIILNNVNFTNPYATYTYNGKTGADPFPIIPTANFNYPTGAAYMTWPSLHPRTPNLQSWALSFQKQLGTTWSASVSYIGNHGVHIGSTGELNPGLYIPGSTCAATGANTIVPGTGTSPCTTSGNLSLRRRLSCPAASCAGNTIGNPAQGAYFSTVTLLNDKESSNYNGVFLTLQKQMSHSVSFVANYTYSHCLDNGEPASLVTADAFQQDLHNEYGNCAFDRRQQLTINAVLQSPKFGNVWAERIAGNFQLTPIVGYLSGDWLTVITGGDQALVGTQNGQRASVIGNPRAAHVPAIILNGTTPAYKVFNGSAFAAPTAPVGFTGNVIDDGFGPITVGPLGNSRRNSVSGPGIPTFDLALVRSIKFFEHNEIQLRAEAFNILNKVRLYDPNLSTANPGTLGYSTAPTTTTTPGFPIPQDPRIMQFAVKYNF